jgi:hypothetical protein
MSPHSNRILRLLLLVGLVAGSPVSGQEGRDTLSVFFLGNSYTYFNNLPGILEGISEGLHGPRVIADSHTHGGYTLRRHLDDGHLPGAFGTRGADGPGWDVVVLQEQSSLATTTDTLTGDLGSPDQFQGAVRDLGTVVRRLGATPALYMTWAKKRWPNQLDEISEAYRGVAAEVDSPVAPVGAAWAVVIDQRPDLELFVADGSHPTPAGSYLAACVIYATLTGESPVGAPREVWGDPWTGGGPIESATPTLLVSLSPGDAAFLQETAWTVASAQAAR